MQAGEHVPIHKSSSGKSLPSQSNSPFCLSPIERSDSQRNSPFCLSPIPRSDSPYSRSSSPRWSQHFSRVAELWGAAGSSDPGQLWETVRREKAARGYPWTHLDHNQEEEVWLDPLSLPQDIGRETIKRRDGTIPAEWFHLPDGASPPSVQEMLKNDSPEPDYADSDLADAADTDIAANLPPGHSSPPLCGRHRNSRSKSRERRLHKTSVQEQCKAHSEQQYSIGHVSITVQGARTVQSSSTVQTNGEVQPNTVQTSRGQHTWKQTPQKQKQQSPGYEPVGGSSNKNHPGYEPVGGSNSNNHPVGGSSSNNHPGYEPVGGSNSGSNKGLVPISRSPSSRLPTLPNQESIEDNDSDVTPGCFSMIKRSRSRSKSREKINKKGKPPRSASENSAHSDHPYETPKLLTKSDHSVKTSTPKSRKKKRSDIEDGYEQVGTLEDWINDKEKEYEDLENKEELKLKEEKLDRSNVSMKSCESQRTLDSQKSKNASEHLVTIKETETGKVIFKEIMAIKTENDKQEKEIKIKQEKELKESKLKEEKEQKERKNKEQKELKEQKARKKKEEKETKEKKTLEEKELKEKRAKEEKEQKELKANNEREMKEQKAIREKDLKEQRLKEEREEKLLKENKKKEDQKHEKQQKLQKDKEEKEKRLQQEKEEKKKKLIEEKERKEKDAERNLLYPTNKEIKSQDTFEKSAIIEESILANQKKLIEEKEIENNSNQPIQNQNDKETELLVNNQQHIIISPKIQDDTFASLPETKSHEEIESEQIENMALDNVDNMQKQRTNKETNEIQKNLKQDSIIIQKVLEKQEKKQIKALAKKEKEMQEKDLKQRELEKAQEQEKKRQHELKKTRQDEELKKQKGIEKHEEKERKALAKKEKEMQEKELKELKKNASKEKKSKLLNKSFFKFGNKSKSMSDIGNEDNQKKTQTERDFEDVEFNTEGKSSSKKLDFEDVEFNTEGKSSSKKLDEVYEPVSPSSPPSSIEPCEGVIPEPSKITQPIQHQAEPGKIKQTDMALKPRAQKGEVSVVTSDDFAAFQQVRGTNGYHDEDEEMDFTPQNGYIDPDEEEVDGSGRQSRSRAKPGLMNRISSFRIPSPGEMKDNYLNSNFHKSFHQTLSVKSKVEDQEVQKARQALTQTKSVHELSEIHGLSDFPIPRFRRKSEKQGKDSGEEQAPTMKMPTNMGEAGQMAFNTLPRSWKEQNIVTAHKENVDPVKLEGRQNLTKTKTPAELAQFNSLSDIPVPSGIKKLFDKKEEDAKEPKKRRHSESDQEAPPSPWDIYHTIPRSLRETKLITNTKESDVDDVVIEERRALVESKTPAELSAITKISDFPVPTRIENLFRAKSGTRAGSKQGSVDDVNQAKRRRSRSASLPKGMNSAFYNSLPRQLTTQNIVTSVKTEEDLETLEKHRELTQTKTVAQLSAITSIADLPIPEKLENFFKGGDKKEKEADDADSTATPKPKLNFSKMNLNDMYNTLPKSLTMELSVGSPVQLDKETAEARKKLTEEKTPMELSQIGSIAEFPLPSALENIFTSKPTPPERNRDREEKRKRNLTTGAFLSPDFMEWTQQQLLVKQMEEEPSETLQSRRDLVESKTPMEMSQIHGISDFPIPEKVETLLRPKKRVLKSTEEKEMSKKVSRSWSSLPTDSASMYATLPKSFKQELMVGSRVEDPEVVAERREVVKNKSVSELSQIHSFAEFPVPASIEAFFKQKAVQSTANGGPPVATPVSTRPTSPQSVVGSIYESLPRSLTGQQLLVKSKMVEDNEKLQERRETTSSKSPAELSQITSLSDIPIPTPIQNLLKKKSSEPGSEDSPVPPPRKKWEDMTKESLYESIPSSFREELLVKQIEEDLDPEELSQRQELVKTKTPGELSSISRVSEFPIPDCVENFVHKMQAGADKSPEEVPNAEEGPNSPALSRMESIYASIPSSLKTGLIVKTRTEDPEMQQARAETVKSKSVHELSQIHSLAEFPIPTTFENLAKKAANGPIERKKKFKEMEDEDTSESAPKSMSENIYATLPRSLKSELAVKSVVEDQDVTILRREVIQTKSVSELATINSLADFPIPANIEKLMHKATHMANNEPKEDSAEEILAENTDSPQVPSRNAKKDLGIYASLPRSLKSELLVRSKVIEDDEVLQQRQELIATKSPAELSQIHSLGEIPIPSRIEAWLHGTQQGADRSTIGEGGEEEAARFPRSKKELNDAFYHAFPSMDTHCIVRSKVEDPDVLINRQQLSQNRSIHELSKIRNLNELPIPGDFFRLPDIPLPKVKSILKLIARSPSQNKAPVASETYHSYQPAPGSDSDVMSTPMTDDGMFHSMASRDGIPDSPASSITKDREFGYEVISKPREDPVASGIMATYELHEDILESLPTPPTPAPESPPTEYTASLPAPPTPELEAAHDGFGLAGLTKGTPERNMRGKTLKKNRRSKEVPEDGVMSVSSTVTDDIPPALPPKRGSPQKGMSLESQPSLDDDIEIEAIPVKNLAEREKEFSPPLPPRREKSSSTSVEPREMTDQATPEERIQSRPLPPPPAPPRTLKKQSSGSVEPEEGRLSRTSTRSGRSAVRDDLTYADTENFKSVAETLNSTRTMAATETQQFHTVQDTMDSHTLLVTGNKTRSEDDLTLADSVVDDMVSCCETLIVDDEHENLDTCADTLTAAQMDDQFYDDDDNPYPSVDFNAMMLGPGGHIVEPESPGVVRDSGVSRQVEEGAEELSKELLEHVENLRTTLDNMSTRLGSSSKSDVGSDGL